ncbi:COR domain-containing protein [Methylovulum psychrotolerans]|uniref:non-specific serine/threonine protein kinase n=1 Tax=Methylovulum psychrotolerans TaxID=1704499 RepID=A0A2S5CQE4_9GAMM|nr:COR domain-containing protein [Methylovulum psychrotolerans]POZ53039.1 GTP-binding protein [Methylovulum psychrotolerans]
MMTKAELLAKIHQAKEEQWLELKLPGQGITELPPEIGQLQCLQKLGLWGNQLTELPHEIGQLQALQEFDLWGNQLNQLPSQIGQLHALQRLDLWDNQLSHLPPEIGQLQALQLLDLGYNPLNDSLTSVTTLKNLRVLDLCNTSSDFPPFLARLKKQGDGIYIPQHSPNLPEEFLKKTSLDIYHYLTSGQGQLLPLNEAKLLFLGDGTSGKSSLVHYLLHNKFARKTKTEGIDRLQWKGLTVNDQQIRLNFWDFGGQEILHATHQFFLTKRSIYILVLDARHGEQESRLEYWLKLIQSFGGDSPVLVVTNKTDEEHRLTLNQRFLQDKYPNIVGFYPTSCRTGAGIPELKARIIDTVAALPHIHDQMPASWFKLKNSLERRKENYLSYEAYQALCAKQKITETDSQNTLCGFLHDLGIVLNFRDDDRFDRLRETNVLNPEWVTNAAYKLLNNVELCKNHGVFSKSDLANLLDAKNYPSPKEHQFIIDMLQKFEMCFPLADTASDYLIPQLLPNNEPDLGWDKANSLRFEYHYDILPHSVFSRFIVRLHELIFQKIYWRTGVVLQLDGNKALVTADIEDKKIFIWVSGTPATRRELLAIIRKELQHIHRTIKGLSAKARIPYKHITVDYQHLLNLEAMGQTTYIPEGLDEAIKIQELLAAVEPKTAAPTPTAAPITIKHIKKLEITGLWGNPTVITWDFQTDVNVLAGMNGSGKSTILSCLYQLIAITPLYAQRDYLSMVKKIRLWTDDNKEITYLSDNKLNKPRITAEINLISTFDAPLKALEAVQKLSDERVTTELDWQIHHLQQAYLEYQLNIGRKKTADNSTDITAPQTRFLAIIDELFTETGKKVNRDKNHVEFLAGDKELSAYQLSSGEKQLLIILLTVLVQDNKPSILLMDEPEISLHIDWQRKLISHIRELNPNVQIIIASHSPAIIMEGWLDKVVEISDITAPQAG